MEIPMTTAIVIAISVMPKPDWGFDLFTGFISLSLYVVVFIGYIP
jgi:hypothetical protein